MSSFLIVIHGISIRTLFINGTIEMLLNDRTDALTIVPFCENRAMSLGESSISWPGEMLLSLNTLLSMLMNLRDDVLETNRYIITQLDNQDS